MKKLIETFVCTDATGKQYTINRYEEFRKSRCIGHEGELEPVMEHYSCGLHAVTRTGSKTFQIVSLQTEVQQVE